MFEAIHQNEYGTMIGVHEDLNPILISEHSELFEMLVVQVSVDKKRYPNNYWIWAPGGVET